jgi:hypothetical protein
MWTMRLPFRAILLAGVALVAYRMIKRERREAFAGQPNIGDFEARLARVDRATHSMSARQPFEDPVIQPVSAADLGLPAKSQLGGQALQG